MKPEAAEAWYQDYDGLRVHTGKSAVKTFTYGRQGEWWLYQQVNVLPGDVMTFSVWLSAWQCFDYAVCSYGKRSDRPTTMHLRVGIDPTGGMSITGTNVVWSQEGDAHRVVNTFWFPFTVTARGAQSFKATVFVYANPDWSMPAYDLPGLYNGNYARTNNDLYVDTGELVIERHACAIYFPVIKK